MCIIGFYSCGGIINLGAYNCLIDMFGDMFGGFNLIMDGVEII